MLQAIKEYAWFFFLFVFADPEFLSGLNIPISKNEER